jgi:hypothetical protein
MFALRSLTPVAVMEGLFAGGRGFSERLWSLQILPGLDATQGLGRRSEDKRMKNSKSGWKTQRFFRMLPRALFHMKKGKKLLKTALSSPGVYVLYRNDEPYYIGKTGKPLIKRLAGHALKPNWRRYNFWNHFSAFAIEENSHRDEVEAILISAMPTAANSANPKIPRMPLDRHAARLLNDIQALTLTGKGDTSGVEKPEEAVDDDS